MQLNPGAAVEVAAGDVDLFIDADFADGGGAITVEAIEIEGSTVSIVIEGERALADPAAKTPCPITVVPE